MTTLGKLPASKVIGGAAASPGTTFSRLTSLGAVVLVLTAEKPAAREKLKMKEEETMPEENGTKPKRPWLRLVLLIGLVAAGFAALRASGLSSHLTLDNLQGLAHKVRDLGWIAPVVYVALWMAACLFFLPGLPITLLGAVVFGAWWGMLWVVIGSNLGAALAFLAARYAVRPVVESWAAKNPLFRRIDQGVARNGWRMVMITRLVPLFPFNLQNYAYGLTSIGLPTFALVSLVCMLPGTAAYCFAGGALVSGQGDIKKTLLYLAVGAVTLVLISLIPGWLKKKVSDADLDLKTK